MAADPLDVAPCLECETDIINNKPKAITLYLHYGERCQEVVEVDKPHVSLIEEVARAGDAVEASVLSRNTQSEPTERRFNLCTVL